MSDEKFAAELVVGIVITLSIVYFIWESQMRMVMFLFILLLLLVFGRMAVRGGGEYA